MTDWMIVAAFVAQLLVGAVLMMRWEIAHWERTLRRDMDALRAALDAALEAAEER